MVLRKVLQFTNILGLTLPKEFSNALDLKKHAYVEMYLKDKNTIIIKTHRTPIKGITVDE